MINHGASHGFSVLFLTIVAAFIFELLRPLIPILMSKLAIISEPIIKRLKIPITNDMFNIILLAFILAIIWGMIFKSKFDKN